MVYNNLRKALDGKSITLVMYSKILGIDVKSVQNKLRGKTDWTLKEAFCTMELFPEYDMKYLFATDDATE